MKENKYDEQKFFMKYSEMERSKKGCREPESGRNYRKFYQILKIKKFWFRLWIWWHCKYAADREQVLFWDRHLS